MNNHIQSYFKNKKDVIALYLFGSYASGKVHASSDIDLGILFDSRERGFINQLLEEYLLELSRILRKDVHLTALNFGSEALLKQIFKKGKCLIVNDAKKLALFKMRMYSKIVNFHLYRSQMQSAIIRKVREGS
jgi:predicted nucleotidyltransferase